MILVTGGSGFLGSYLIRYLVRDGFQVRALKRTSSDLCLLGEAKDKVQWVDGDVLDIPSLEDAFENVTKVYHVASVISFLSSERSVMMKVNIEGTANVVNVALSKGIQKLLYVSSSSALGKSKSGELIDEDVDWNKERLDTNYGLSKFLGESEVWRGIAEGLNAVVVNPAVVLGAGKWEDSSTRIFSAMAQGQPLYPTGSSGYIDVRDVARIMIQLMESEISAQRFIVSAENRKFRDVIFEIAEKLGVRKPAMPLNKWLTPLGMVFDFVRATVTGTARVFNSEVAHIAATNYSYDNKKILSAINPVFIPLTQSITETVAKYRESAARKEKHATLEL